LVVVMTLLVLLAFIATPSFVNTTRTAQVRTAMQQVVAVLRYARAKAVALGRPVLVAFDRERGTFRVLLPTEVVEQQATGNPSLLSELGEGVAWTDEDWWRLSGERLETLDPERFVNDPSPMGRERSLPEGVTIASLRDPDTGDELNLIAFYPDGTASGALLILEGPNLAIELFVSPLTGTLEWQEEESQTRPR
jgi:type II secretory pathway pseudopilin PulG